MSEKKKSRPIHYTEMRKQLDIARIRGQSVRLRFWKLSSGDIVTLDGWLVKGGHWHGGTHRFVNPQNGQIRELRDISIFEYMGSEVYL